MATSARKRRANRRNGLKGGRPRRSDAEARLTGDPKRRPKTPTPPAAAPWLPPRPERPYQRADGSFIFATGRESLLPAVSPKAGRPRRRK